MKKKDLPLILLKIFEEFVELKGKNFIVLNSENYLLKIIDSDKNSNFHFIVEEYKQNATSGNYEILISKCPYSEFNNAIIRKWIKTSELKGYLTSWINLLNQYDNIKSFYDDPIIESFSEEYLEDFKIIDEESYRKPLKIRQIILLANYLEYLNEKIDEYKTESNKNQILEIKQDINNLKENITSSPRAIVGKKLSIIWAKMSKQSSKIIKELIIEGVKEIMKMTIKEFFEGKFIS